MIGFKVTDLREIRRQLDDFENDAREKSEAFSIKLFLILGIPLIAMMAASILKYDFWRLDQGLISGSQMFLQDVAVIFFISPILTILFVLSPICTLYSRYLEFDFKRNHELFKRLSYSDFTFLLWELKNNIDINQVGPALSRDLRAFKRESPLFREIFNKLTREEEHCALIGLEKDSLRWLAAKAVVMNELQVSSLLPDVVEQVEVAKAFLIQAGLKRPQRVSEDNNPQFQVRRRN